MIQGKAADSKGKHLLQALETGHKASGLPRVPKAIHLGPPQFSFQEKGDHDLVLH